ncbi:methyltransferase domain-containing protein, partial [Candidatus Uhrbacteria bacterium]|nr:methyltransferase domain-containing protein [Candidatus Uhrbacteria bacterium]
MSTHRSTIKWYNDNAVAYVAHVRNASDSIYHAYYEKPAMYALIPPLKGKHVLSLGCGSGEDASYLKKRGATRSVGIDISRELINIAKQNHPACEFSVMDMEHLTFPAKSFDFAYSSLAIHYLEDWTKVFKLVYKIVKPGSRFLLSCGHPIYSALALTKDRVNIAVRQLAIVKDEKNNTAEIIGDYLTRKKVKDAFGKNTVTLYHKPISEIITEATSAGFLVEKCIEPRPLAQMKKIRPRDYVILNKIPNFIIFR